MAAKEIEKLKYPVGKFEKPGRANRTQINGWIKTIEELPKKLRGATKGMSEYKLDTTYRPGGWTARQVIHHLADSHLNCYIRIRWALTENNPTIKAYYEERWAELPDAKSAPVNVSLDLLEALHKRWVLLLKSLTKDDLERTFFHPESKVKWRLYEILALYSWHCRHHLAHVLMVKH